MPISDFRTKIVIISVLALVIAGTCCIALRLYFMRPASPMSLESHWRIHYAIKFRPKGERIATGWVALPAANPNLEIRAETFSHSQIEVSFKENRENREREVFFFTPQKANPVRFEAQVDVIISRKTSALTSITEDLSPEDSEKYLMEEDKIQVRSDPVSNVLSAIRSQGDDLEKILFRIFSFCADMRSANSNEKNKKTKVPPSDAASVIERGQGTTLGRARAMVSLCRAAHIPALLVTGILCTDSPVKQPHHWVEAHMDGRWRRYDPALRVYENLGPEYLTLRRGQTKIIEIEEAKDEYVRCSVKRKVSPRDVALSRDNKVLSVLDFTNLPSRLSDAVSLILLLPLGGLVISIFSNIFGLKSFGYFIPALIGLSFVDVQWVPGIMIFIVIISIGLASRALLDRLHLNKMPRLTLVLVFVVLSLTIMVSLLDLLNIRPSPRALLLPMISLTMVIEQFHTRVEGQGYKSGFKKLGITLLVALCCWFLFSIDKIQWTFLTFPESEFFIAAALVFVGSYKESQSVAGEPSSQDG
jgi:7 transmembrane helices usually fused to an inactive transglutaminase/Transglutaminase-like superfamily